MVATSILKQEVWEAMEELEETLAELPGVDAAEVAAVAKRAGNSSPGRPPHPRPEDGIGTTRYLTDLLHMTAKVLRDQERRISRLEGKK